jgi:hypothetical protein
LSRGPGLRVLALAVLVASVASGQPTVWERAREPRRAIVERHLLAAERLLMEPISSPVELFRAQRTAARLLASEPADGPLAGSPRLDAVLGAVAAEPYVADYAGARLRFERALAGPLPAPVAARVQFSLGVVCARLSDSRCERRAYDAVLELATDRDLRAIALMNRAEGRMLAMDLAGAIVDYQQARRATRERELIVLAGYGLAAAQERSGDLPSALAVLEAGHALVQGALPYSPLDDPQVFFVPDFDVHYYRGLDELAVAHEAEVAGDAETARLAWAAAAEQFTRYLDAAVPAGAPWIERARLHVASCRRRLGLAAEPGAVAPR